VLGQGGLAVVLAAMHEQLDERVALKILLPEWSDNADVVARFLREGRASIKIHSEHVVRVLDVGETDVGAPYIVMEYLDGNDLAKVVATNGALPIETAVDHIAQACEAIAEAHALSIIHRDLKPANLFLTYRADGSACVKVLDFGISKIRMRRSTTMALTNPSMVMGSPPYMSPEQLQSTRDADERSDVWALGACLHELLSGQPPFLGDTAPELCAQVMIDTPTRLSSLRPEVPEGLATAVLVALEKEPGNRFPNVGELAKAIAGYGSIVALASAERSMRVLELAGIARSTSPPSPTVIDASGGDQEARNRHPVWIGAIAVALLGALAIVVVLVAHPSFFSGPAAAATTPPPASTSSEPPASPVPTTTQAAAGGGGAQPTVTPPAPANAPANAPAKSSTRRASTQFPAQAAPPPAATTTGTDGLFEERK
jgi:serine/threonine-protein kinase